MKKTALLSLFATALVAAFAPIAQANFVIYSTNFNGAALGGPYVDGALNNQNGWVNSSGLGTNNITVAGASTGTGNGHVSLTTTGDDERTPFSANVNTGSVWLEADINLSAAQATGDYFIHMGDGGTSNFYARTFAKSSGAGFVMALGVNSTATPTYGSTVLNFGQTYHMVAEYDFVSGALNDTAELFIDPAHPLGAGDTPYVNGTPPTLADATQIGAVYLRQGTAGNAATVSSVDNIVVTATVPEPATLTLAGLGVVGLIGLARRRRSR